MSKPSENPSEWSVERRMCAVLAEELIGIFGYETQTIAMQLFKVSRVSPDSTCGYVANRLVKVVEQYREEYQRKTEAEQEGW